MRKLTFIVILLFCAGFTYAQKGKVAQATSYFTSGKMDEAKKLIDEFVLLEIKVLLQNTEFPIQEISNRLNFPDQSYLGRYFKRQMGISPSAYREKFIK